MCGSHYSIGNTICMRITEISICNWILSCSLSNTSLCGSLGVEPKQLQLVIPKALRTLSLGSLYHWEYLRHVCPSFRAVNIMNRHVTQSTFTWFCGNPPRLIPFGLIWVSTILSQSTTFFHISVAPITISNFRKWCVHWYKIAPIQNIHYVCIGITQSK